LITYLKVKYFFKETYFIEYEPVEKIECVPVEKTETDYMIVEH